MEITTVGIDLAKNVFQVQAISSTGDVVVPRSLTWPAALTRPAPPAKLPVERWPTRH
jgi:transposase